MISFTTPQMPTIFAVIVVALLSACGGGGGGSSAGEGGFTASNANTKPQSSSSSQSSQSKSSQLNTSAGSSLASQSSKPSSGIDTTPPSAPRNLEVKLSAFDVVTLSWTESTDNVGIKSYAIYRNQVQIDIIDAPVASFIDFNVAADSTYTYGISAADITGNWSNVTTVTTKTASAPLEQPTNSSASSSASSFSSSSTSSNPLDTQAPTPPVSIKQIAAYANRVDLEWGAATDNITVSNYNIYRDGVLIKTLNGSTLEYSDKTTIATKQYLYEVEAVDASGNHSLTRQPLLVSTPAASIAGTVNLAWTPPRNREDGSNLTSTELGGYIVLYKSKIDTHYTQIYIKDGTASSYTLSGLLGDYDFQIAAYDTNGLHSRYITILPQ